ncbi:MAG: hypothetical protein CO098_06950 [Bacteroidetes bacterium CG_4_9_14_3_um_filter_41_19]|nr:MAG: hypothetical protein CO098_06950 [Bacteroidetes bacterium CG_4_9_14_3_um_filter_41_19]
MTQTATESSLEDTVLSFVDTSAKKLADKFLQFDTEFVDGQRFYLTEKKIRTKKNISSDRKPTPQQQNTRKSGSLPRGQEISIRKATLCRKFIG